MSLDFKVGHFTDLDRGTGCTVILCPENTRASAFARGISPGTREFALLSPFRKIQEIHALLLTGGSAFGLDAAAGVIQLDEFVFSISGERAGNLHCLLGVTFAVKHDGFIIVKMVGVGQAADLETFLAEIFP